MHTVLLLMTSSSYIRCVESGKEYVFDTALLLAGGAESADPTAVMEVSVTHHLHFFNSYRCAH
jgi:hypothetical protein